MERYAQLATIMIGLVAFTFALIATRDISAPIVLALALGIVLSPISEFWARVGFPPVMGALTSLMLTLLLIVLAGLAFQPVVVQLVSAAPKVWADVQDLLAVIRGMMQGVSDMAQDVAGTASTAAPEDENGDAMPIPSMGDALLLAPGVVAQILTFAGTLFFFLLSRGQIYTFLARRLSEPSNRAITAQRLREAEFTVSRYFLTITAINAGLGMTAAAAFHLIGLPGAALWGTMAFILNFVIYLGPAVLAVALLFTGVAVFDGLMSFAPAAIFVTLNTIEGQFFTPTLVGRNMDLNPLLVFVSLVFGIWMWGAIGGIVAIPLLLWWRVILNGVAAPAHVPTPTTAG